MIVAYSVRKITCAYLKCKIVSMVYTVVLHTPSPLCESRLHSYLLKFMSIALLQLAYADIWYYDYDI